MWFEPRMDYPSRIRVLHASPDAPAVDVYVNDNLAISNLPYKGYTNYIELMPGDYKIKLTAAGQPGVVALEKALAIPSNVNLTVAAINRLQDLELYPIQDWKSNNEEYQDFKEVERDCGCNKSMQYDMKKQKHGYDIKQPCPIEEYMTTNGYMQMPYGTMMEGCMQPNQMPYGPMMEGCMQPSQMPYQPMMENKMYPEPNNNNTCQQNNNMYRDKEYGFVRFIHLSPNAPAVDITLPDGTLVFSDIQYKEVTDYIPLTPGNYTVQVRPFGSDQVVLTVPNVVVQQNVPSTIYAVGLIGSNPPLEAIQLIDDE